MSAGTVKTDLQLRVVSDAIAGGGLDLRAGQLVDVNELGEHADSLLAYGALEPVETAVASDQTAPAAHD